MPGSSPSWNLWVYSKYLTHKEDRRADQRDHQVDLQRLLLVGRGRVHRHHHREAGDQQNDRVQRAQRSCRDDGAPRGTPAGAPTACSAKPTNKPPNSRISVARNSHMPIFAGIELLLERGEVVLQPRIVLGVMLAALVYSDRS